MTFGIRTARGLLAVLLLTGLLVSGLRAPAAEAATAREIRNGIERRINDARTSRGLRKLRVNTTIQKYAQGHAQLMADTTTMFHDAAFSTEAPGDAEWVAENVGYVPGGSGAAARMHRAFMKSDGHRANILKPRATHMGIGVVKRNGTVWVVERFADLW